MKKLFVAATSAAVMTLGGVALTAPAANASDCGYTTCQKTVASASAPKQVDQGDNIRITLKVLGQGTTVKPTGKAVFKIKRKGGGYVLKRSGFYNGGVLKIFTGKLFKKGKYDVKVRYISNPNGVFADSIDRLSFKVS